MLRYKICEEKLKYIYIYDLTLLSTLLSLCILSFYENHVPQCSMPKGDEILYFIKWQCNLLSSSRFKSYKHSFGTRQRHSDI